MPRGDHGIDALFGGDGKCRAYNLFGPPGCGKGTLAKNIGIKTISSGEIIRHAIQSGESDLADYVNAGALVPDDLFFSLLDRMVDWAVLGGVTVDGVERTLAHRAWLAPKLEGFSVYPIFIDTDVTVAKERCMRRARGRDDQISVVEKRFEVYHSETEPLIEQYRTEGTLIELDGHQTPQDIVTELRHKVPSPITLPYRGMTALKLSPATR